jgi:arabinogalactan endo-1,4-beta-galactosidase
MKRLICTILLAALAYGAAFAADEAPAFYRGVDLSYVNEVEDFGGEYRERGELVDPFELFARKGANLVRARIWIDATWTKYSDLEDVKRTFARAKAEDMDLLLAFHYSDTWADPKAQFIPARWKSLSDEELVQAVHDYTRDTLLALDAAGLLPELVQIGNETNGGLLKRGKLVNEWGRDVALLNAGIRATAEVAAATGRPIRTAIHIAQPQNAAWFFREAAKHGLAGFDIIALSYYPQWSPLSPEGCGAEVAALKKEFGRDVLIVETAAPWTLDQLPETARSILNQAVPGYKINPAGQRDFLIDLTRSIKKNGGLGVVYWEPAWVSSKMRTRWGQGSHWENATFFDFNNGNELLPGAEFLSADLD